MMQRPASMAALKRLGLCAGVTPRDLAEDVYPAAWADREVIDDWAPGAVGQPTLAQIFAGWALCPQAERDAALAASSKGRLVRGRRCSELLPVRAVVAGVGGAAGGTPYQQSEGKGGGEGESGGEGGAAASWAALMAALGIETVYMGEDCDFSLKPPRQGFLLLTPSSLLNVLVSDEAARPDLLGLNGAQKEELLRYLISPLDESRQVAPSILDPRPTTLSP